QLLAETQAQAKVKRWDLEESTRVMVSREVAVQLIRARYRSNCRNVGGVDALRPCCCVCAVGRLKRAINYVYPSPTC
ncbi:MAG: hypothetical protein AAF485_09820, partial [Chloroflexota bacterium]